MCRCVPIATHALVLLAATTAAAASTSASDYASFTSAEVHSLLRDLYRNGEMVALEKVAKQAIEENPAAATDTRFTTPYEYMGVAQYALGDLDKATKTFEEVVRFNNRGVESWLQLGKCYLYALEMPQAAAALEKAVLQDGAKKETHTLFKVRNWMSDWHDREPMLDQIQDFLDSNLESAAGVNALDFAEFSPGAPGGDQPLCCDASALHLQTPELRVGFVSSDFGVHPVSALMRGLLEFLSGANRKATVVYCFSLTAESSWWRRNISRSVDHMVSLVGKNPSEGAEVIKSHGIHMLIDLNGHTLHSGLSMFNYRPSPVQMSSLGYPMTAGSSAIDFFISDAISTPAEYSPQIFSEKLLLLPTHYIVNDHMQLLGHTIEGERPLLSHLHGDASVFVFATFSNWQKIDPNIFSAWMDIMARVPHSVLWFLRYPGHEDAESNLKREANAHGVDGEKRLVLSHLAPWIHHTHSKRAADLILDTSMKNGHTTMIDALMAGVPVVTLEGNRMSNRAGSSALHAIDLHELTVNSLKEYVDVAVFLATHRHVLRKLRAQVETRSQTMRATLREWFRVLRPGAALFVSVPDLLVLSSLFANATTTDDERFFIMNMIYGGQVDAFDVHKVGFFAPLLESYLQDAGFCDVERVDTFGLFRDTSTMVYKDVAISLNVKAVACKPGSEDRIRVDLEIDAAQQ